MKALETSRALWNRSSFDLESDEVLAQVLDRGEMWAWRALYRMRLRRCVPGEGLTEEAPARPRAPT